MHNHENTWARLRHRLDDVLDEAIQADGAASGKIRVRDPGSQGLRTCAHRGLSYEYLERFGMKEPDDRTLCAEVIRRRRRVVVPDISRDGQRQELAEQARSDGFKGMQSTPIVSSAGEIVGTLTTLFRVPHRPSRSAELVLDYCARKAADIIEQLGLSTRGESLR